MKIERRRGGEIWKETDREGKTEGGREWERKELRDRRIWREREKKRD